MMVVIDEVLYVSREVMGSSDSALASKAACCCLSPLPISCASYLANLPLSFICDGDADAHSYITLVTTDWQVIQHRKFEHRL